MRNQGESNGRAAGDGAPGASRGDGAGYHRAKDGRGEPRRSGRRGDDAGAHPGVGCEDDRVLEVLADEEGKALQGDQIRAAFPDLAAFVDPGIREAMRAAGSQLQARASKALAEEKARALQRLERALTRASTAGRSPSNSPPRASTTTA
jgi:hypothetical protein